MTKIIYDGHIIPQRIELTEEEYSQYMANSFIKFVKEESKK